MQKKLAALIGLRLPFYTIGIIALLIMVSFASYTISSIIFIDKLILLAVLLSPMVFTLGAIVSIIALVKFESKVASLIGIVLNIVLLAALLCFIKPFLVEFKFLI